LYFCDVYGGGVFRLRADGGLETIVERRKYIGGLCLHADGGIVVSGRDVSHVHDGEMRVILEAQALATSAAPVVGFGDLHADARGRVYVGAVRKTAAGDFADAELLRIDRAGEAVQLYGGVLLSNGIATSADQRWLAHADSERRLVRLTDLFDDTTPPARSFSTELVAGRPDGLAFDVDGGIWVAFLEAGCVARFTMDGAIDLVADVPATDATSVCFTGPDNTALIVTTLNNTLDPPKGACAFRFDVGVAGAPVARSTV
jgi:gluconolactonase